MKYIIRCLVTILVINLQTGQVTAQGKIFFRTDSIVGTSTVLTPDNKKLINIIAASIGAQNVLNIGSSSGGVGAGKSTPGTLTLALEGVVELQDFKKLFFNKSILPKCYVIYTRNGADSISYANDYYIIALGNARIIDIAEAGVQGEMPTTNISLAYGVATYYYRKTNALGVPIITPVTSNWNYIKNTDTDAVALPSKY